ncbi:hypothetical protein ACFV2D_20240 [Streptomyces capillispiralis]|uniref:hypothetical protein n=1 Tax=Streptomyces capillispiralis TaxID=68182 RepID=UPI00367E64C4
MPTAEPSTHFTDALDDGAPRGWALVRIRTEHAGGGWAVDDSAVWSSGLRLPASGRRARVVRARRNPGAPAQSAAGTVNS